MRLTLMVAICAISTTPVSAFKWPWEKDSTSLTSSQVSTSTGGSGITANSASTSWSGVILTSTGEGVAYAPRQTSCPDGSILRKASKIAQDEKDYILQRHLLTTPALKNFLSSVSNLTDFDADSFFSAATRNISIALAFSGGGTRAMLCGAGELMALDNRTSALNEKGLGGLLQSSSYILGISGGSWLVGTLALNDWITIESVLRPDLKLWNISDSIFNPNGVNIFATLKYYNQIGQAVDAKQDAGYATSITDVWGRALSYKFFDPETTYNGGENVTWTSIQKLDSYKNHLMPFPVVLANGRNPGTYIVNLNSTVFEFTPYELGSWDPSLQAFVNLTYLGTALDNGTSVKQCVTNFDNAGFILGTLSSLFNQIFVRFQKMDGLNWALKQVLGGILGAFSENDVDIASYEPNPFYNSPYGNLDSMISNKTLHLVDGGEDQQNVPLYPFIQPSRDVDIIFAYDNSGDTSHRWPNGSSLTHTYLRQFGPQGKGTPFPYVPLVDQFLSGNLTERPVFFGCNASKLNDLVAYHNNTVNNTDIPLVVYMPNSRYTFNANTSTFKTSYERSEVNGIVSNGFSVSTRGNFLADSLWNKCVGCAIIRREQERRGLEQSDECKQCFENYCWDGGIEDTPALTVSIPSSMTLLALLALLTGSTTLTSLRSSGTIQGQSQSQSQSQSSTQTRRNTAPLLNPPFEWLYYILPFFI